MKAFLQDPASHINTLNQIMLQQIETFKKDGKAVTKNVTAIIEAMLASKIIDSTDIETVLLGRPVHQDAKVTKKFVCTRLQVLFENLVDQVTEVDDFDYVSKVLLEMYAKIIQVEEPAKGLKLLAEPKQLMGRLLVRAMRDQGTLQLHYRQLQGQFQDIALVALAGLNDQMTKKDNDIKRKTLYSMLNEFPVFNDLKKVKTTIIDIGESHEEEEKVDSQIVKELKLALKKGNIKHICNITKEYEKAYISFMSQISLKQADLVKKVLLEMPKKVIYNFENPLVLSDFITHYLNQEEDIETQVLALRAIFILLEKHGLDYPNYYTKLYQMIKPKIIAAKSDDESVQIQSIFNMPEKGRFLRLLDLSLRSPILATQLIAAFLKRLWRIVASWGACFTNQDLMFLLGFTQNLLMRHPKCLRLIHRKSASVMELAADPYREDESDPLNSRALHSSLWELETVLRQHMDSAIRNYAKVFKTEFVRKTAYTKCEEFTQADPLAVLGQELDEVDNEREGEAFKKHLMIKHGQYSFADQMALGKRNAVERFAQDDQEFNAMMDEANQPTKRARFAEEFEDINDMFALHQ